MVWALDHEFGACSCGFGMDSVPRERSDAWRGDCLERGEAGAVGAVSHLQAHGDGYSRFAGVLRAGRQGRGGGRAVDAQPGSDVLAPLSFWGGKGSATRVIWGCRRVVEVAPFQGLGWGRGNTQGVALGYRMVPRWGGEKGGVRGLRLFRAWGGGGLAFGRGQLRGSPGKHVLFRRSVV